MIFKFQSNDRLEKHFAFLLHRKHGYRTATSELWQFKASNNIICIFGG